MVDGGAAAAIVFMVWGFNQIGFGELTDKFTKKMMTSNNMSKIVSLRDMSDKLKEATDDLDTVKVDTSSLKSSATDLKTDTSYIRSQTDDIIADTAEAVEDTALINPNVAQLITSLSQVASTVNSILSACDSLGIDTAAIIANTNGLVAEIDENEQLIKDLPKYVYGSYQS
uniref:Uncharacterized protein n=1 Tax=viral metagenome TaxID=1070528 RepID=A0A2V0RAP6_9ZZZZ